MSRDEVIRREIEEQRKNGAERFSVIDSSVADRYGIGEYKMVEGDHYIRIIPPKDESQHFAKKVYVHEQIGQGKRTFLCLEQMGKGQCPICEAYRKLKIKNPQSAELENLKYHQKRYMIVVDFKNQQTIGEGWKWIKFGPKTYEQLMACIQNRRTGTVVDVSDPKTGRCIVFTRKGNGKTNTTYLGFTMESEVCEIPADWLEIPDFDELLKWPDVNEMEEAVEMYSSTGNSRVLNEAPKQEEESIRKPFASSFAGRFSQPAKAEVAPVEEATQKQVVEAPISTATSSVRDKILSFQNKNR